jgi:putative ABC transport system ATP-binding protein
MALAQLENVSKEYVNGEIKFLALHQISLEFGGREFAGLIGPSGSGKTTLLNLIGGLDDATGGTVRVFGKDLGELDEKGTAELRRENTGFIFQTFNLFPVYTAYENVEFPLILSKVPPAERKERVLEALAWVGLSDKKDSPPSRLSGGQAQRVAIARAIVKRPKLVLADEPTANLDKKTAISIIETMVKLNEELGIAFLFATHDEKVMQYLQRRVYLEDGRLVEDRRDGAQHGDGASSGED